MNGNVHWTKEQADLIQERIEKSKKSLNINKQAEAIKPEPPADRPSKPPHQKVVRGRATHHRRHVTGEMNTTEKKFYEEYLVPRLHTEEFISCFFEQVTLRLAPDTRYTPDFMVCDKDGYIKFFEVKGTTREKSKITGAITKEIPFAQDDAIVKLKVSANQFPFEFYIAFPKHKSLGNGWNVVEK